MLGLSLYIPSYTVQKVSFIGALMGTEYMVIFQIWMMWGRILMTFELSPRGRAFSVWLVSSCYDSQNIPTKDFELVVAHFYCTTALWLKLPCIHWWILKIVIFHIWMLCDKHINDSWAYLYFTSIIITGYLCRNRDVDNTVFKRLPKIEAIFQLQKTTLLYSIFVCNEQINKFLL